jgi:hypothetical protein
MISKTQRHLFSGLSMATSAASVVLAIGDQLWAAGAAWFLSVCCFYYIQYKG